MPDYTTVIDVESYLNRLCRAISRSKLEREEIALSLSVLPFRMNSDRCWLLGMMMFELIGSASRHDFRRGAGAIRVEVRPAGASVECCIADNGEPDTYVACEGSFSIVDALAAGLGGTVEMKSGPTGTITVVSFPYRW